MWENKSFFLFYSPCVFTDKNRNKQLRKKLFNGSQVINTDSDSGSPGEAVTSLVLQGFCCVSIDFSRNSEA